MSYREGLHTKVWEHRGYIATGVAHAFLHHFVFKLITFSNLKTLGIIAFDDDVKRNLSATNTCLCHKSLVFNFFANITID